MGRPHHWSKPTVYLLALTPEDFHFAVIFDEDKFSKARKKLRRMADPWKVFEDEGKSISLDDMVRLERETTDNGYLRIRYHDNDRERWAWVESTADIRKEVFGALREHFGTDMRSQKQPERLMRSMALPLGATILIWIFTALTYIGGKAADPPPPKDGILVVDNRVEGMKLVGRLLGGPLTFIIGGVLTAGSLTGWEFPSRNGPSFPCWSVPRRRAKSDVPKTMMMRTRTTTIRCAIGLNASFASPFPRPGNSKKWRSVSKNGRVASRNCQWESGTSVSCGG